LSNLIQVEIESLAPGGDAFGRQVGGDGNGRATFVPLAAPGELISARITRQKKDLAFAELVEVLRPSTSRTQAPCALFGVCGGCQWQHVSIEAQQAAKLTIVKRALRFEDVTLFTPSAPFGYRERAKLVSVQRGPQHRLLGFKRRQSHEVVDVPSCPLLATPLQNALAELRKEALAPGEVALQVGIGGSVGIEHGGRAQISLNGDKRIATSIDIAAPGEPPLEIAIGGFAQVGTVANQALTAAVLRHVGPTPGRVLELFAGSGNFTRFLVGVSSHVVASDADLASIKYGKSNVPAATWLAPDAISITDTFDTIVVDPPRAGLDELALDLVRMAAKTLVYVSCDAQTLGRDVRKLAEFGLRLTHVEAFDLMPQTHHVEVVARFSV